MAKLEKLVEMEGFDSLDALFEACITDSVSALHSDSATLRAHQQLEGTMAKQALPHPTLTTARLRLRQFRDADTDAMHACFADHTAMRFWDTPVHTKRTESERAVRRFVDCTPSRYRFWAVAALLEHCFGALGLHRVQALIHPDNAASRALAERLGFRWEGLLRDHLRVGDEWRDDMLYALLASDWAVIQRRS